MLIRLISSTCFSVLCLTALFAGCSTQPRNFATAPVGPVPFVRSNSGPEGTLIVHSAREASMSAPDQVFHSRYDIRSPDGSHSFSVLNQARAFREPQPVLLSPGHYTVVAKARNYGTLTVPVVVQPGRTTVVHLDSCDRPVSREEAGEDCVRLPNGQFAGWKFDATQNNP
jgi:hypothetical protein